MSQTEPTADKVAATEAPQSVPRFAVVGRVNKGKSSVIATLTEDDRVAISPLPGTTRTNTDFPVEVDGTPLFVLTDTPGFEQAPAVLAWLREGEPAPNEREARVVRFVETFASGDQFVEECTLLAPILAGAGILYVVDAQRPYRDNYQAEMEILRWTGRPSMALINRGGDGDHGDDWRRALNQYFKVVRDFDAHHATFGERIRLLTTLRELHEPWRPQVQQAIEALQTLSARRRTEAAQVIAELLVNALTFWVETRGEESIKPRKLEERFHGALRKLEQDARDELAHIYQHDRAIFEDATELIRPVFGDDLFAERTWALLGLSAGQLLATYAVSGAIAGGVIDAGVGGASFGTGAMLGALAGLGATALHLRQRFESAKRLDGLGDRLRSATTSGAAYRVGPFKHPNFPFVLLDRALQHHAALRDRAHALTASGVHETGAASSDLGERMSLRQRKALARLVSRLQKRPDSVDPAVRVELYQLVLSLIPEPAA